MSLLDPGSDELAVSSISTAITDGRNPKYCHAAELTGGQEQKIRDCLRESGSRGPKQYSYPLPECEPESEVETEPEPDNPPSDAMRRKIEEMGREIEQMQQEVADHKETITLRDNQIANLNTKLVDAKNQSRVIAVQLLKGKTRARKIEALFHKKFDRILTLAKARRNIFLYGPTGCGKSHVCGQIADALNVGYGFVSCTAGMSEAVLGGRLLPVGKSGSFEYVVSEFVKCYEQGGLFLLDEWDAADANVALFINAALANGSCAVPNRPKKPYAQRHGDFICAAAANTVGTGADRQYSGRNRLDMASLDRFQIGKVYMDYDTLLEEKLCVDKKGETYTDLLAYCWKVRTAIRNNKLERAMSTRFTADAAHMKREAGWDIEQIFNDHEDGFFSGWREDEIRKVEAEVGHA